MKKGEAKAEHKETAKAVKKVKENVEKTTLGDISALAALKEKMDNKSNKK